MSWKESGREGRGKRTPRVVKACGVGRRRMQGRGVAGGEREMSGRDRNVKGG